MGGGEGRFRFYHWRKNSRRNMAGLKLKWTFIKWLTPANMHVYSNIWRLDKIAKRTVQDWCEPSLNGRLWLTAGCWQRVCSTACLQAWLLISEQTPSGTSALHICHKIKKTTFYWKFFSTIISLVTISMFMYTFIR